MTDEGSNASAVLGPLPHLIKLAAVDGALVSIERERKRTEKTLSTQKEELTRRAIILRDKEKIVSDRKKVTKVEEKSIKSEQERLTERRKALGTFTNYKLQETALREIENNSRQISLREEALLTLLDEAEALSKESSGLRSELEALKNQYDTTAVEATSTFSDLSDRELKFQEERARLLPNIPPTELQTYERVRNRHPDSPIAIIKGSNCSGCFMQIGPQVSLQIARAQGLVKCPGCGRILSLDEKKEE